MNAGRIRSHRGRWSCMANPAIVVSACVAVIWTQLPIAAAWDKDGHEAIGMTTMSALEGGAVAQLKRLMHGRDAVDVAAWAHKVNKKYPWTADLHFQKQSVDAQGKCTGKKRSECPNNKCLVNAMKHLYGKLVHKPDFDIDWGAGIKLTDADYVKFLINLMGDLHQPLHLGCENDNLGRNITAVFRGRKVPLYEIWDHELTATTMKESPSFWWGGWTHVQRTRVEYEMDGQQWKQFGVGMFDRWAEENSKFVCEAVYLKIYHELHDGVFTLHEGLYEQWKRDMLNKMLVAGARTAIVLNSILQQREAKDLKGGTAVTGIEGEDDDHVRIKAPPASRKADLAHQAHGARPKHGPAAAATNFGIFVVVFLIFHQVMRICHGRDPVRLADRAKLQAGGKKI